MDEPEKQPGALVADVAQLAEGERKRVEDTLLEGGTIEDAIDQVRAGGGPEVDGGAVARFFNARPDLQRGRVERMTAAVKAVKAGGMSPGSAGEMMLDAAIMAGLQRLDRRSARMTAREAVTAKMKRDKLRLEEESLRLRTRRQQKEELLITQRTEHEIQRTQLVCEQVRQLKKMADEEGRDLKPSLMEKINAIYGLATLPQIPVDSKEDD